MFKLFNRDNKTRKKTFCFLPPTFNPRMSSLTALFVTHCSNLSIFQLFLICLCLSSFVFSNFCFRSRQLFCLLIIIVCALSVFSVAFSCFSVYFQFICRIRYYTFFEHVCSFKLTVFHCFMDICFAKWVLLLIAN